MFPLSKDFTTALVLCVTLAGCFQMPIRTAARSPIELAKRSELRVNKSDDTENTTEPERTLLALGVSDNGRFLIKQDGTPFFYLADTAWGIVPQTSAAEVDTYLENRAHKKFTVIQFVATWRLHTAFLNSDIGVPVRGYWRRVDYIVNKAEAFGLYVGLLPLWGDAVTSGDVTIANAHAYGEFLGTRYRTHPIIWILGGDKAAGGYEDIWRALAKGIAIGTSGTENYDAVIMSYHPTFRESSSEWFHADPWLDFNMVQSGHCQDHTNYIAVAADYSRRPVKPTMEGEAVYENIPDCLVRGKPKAASYDVRKVAYSSVFAGGHGFTYGANEVYGFWNPGETAFGYDSFWGADTPWRRALDLPGAFHMQHLRTLMESRPYLVRIPDETVVVSPHTSRNDRVQATRDANGSYAFIYISDGDPVSIDMAKISGGGVRAAWYNPRDGTSQSIGLFPNSGMRTFAPPTSGEGSDWVLVLDDASRNFALPGRSLSSVTE